MTPTEELRERVRKRIWDDHMSVREAGLSSGVTHTVIWRFLAGRQIESNTHDRLHAWANRTVVNGQHKEEPVTEDAIKAARQQALLDALAVLNRQPSSSELIRGLLDD